MPSQLWSPRPPSDRSVNPTANADAQRAPSPSRPYQRLRSLPPSSPDVLNARHADRGTNTHSFHPGPRVQPATLLLLAQSGTVDLATALEEPTTRGDGAFRQREETADRTSSDGPDGTPGHCCLCLATPGASRFRNRVK